MKSRGLEFLKWNLEASRFFILKLKLRALFYLRTAVSARWAVKSPLPGQGANAFKEEKAGSAIRQSAQEQSNQKYSQVYHHKGVGAHRRNMA